MTAGHKEPAPGNGRCDGGGGRGRPPALKQEPNSDRLSPPLGSARPNSGAFGGGGGGGQQDIGDATPPAAATLSDGRKVVSGGGAGRPNNDLQTKC